MEGFAIEYQENYIRIIQEQNSIRLSIDEAFELKRELCDYFNN